MVSIQGFVSIGPARGVMLPLIKLWHNEMNLLMTGSSYLPVYIPGKNVAIKTRGEKEASVAVILNVLDPVCVTFKLMQFMFQEPDIPQCNS